MKKLLNLRVTAPIFGLALGFASLTGCSTNDSNPTAVLTPSEQVDEAWGLFQDGDYNGALAEFTAALGRDGTLSDAQNGIGWTLGRMPGRLAEAPVWFSRAITSDTTRYDALGGWAFAIYQTGDFQGALDKSEALLGRRPGWRFLHEQTLDQFDIRLMQASSYYNLGDYTSSYRTVVDHLNPSFEADLTTPAGRRELLDEIERLRRVYG